ncbi:hypothetical protein PROFUN_02602 [Planoprotostelium fungivorum]|uniref:BSD domain-containing protein n=1 Tax=Planoprotostelium fungivorum TaxID=1890364 RepID=A0A2P6MPF0_9EUKA|nr:hypothetical protein PROFUN_02602 [Planoprotostelium fungivorum]
MGIFILQLDCNFTTSDWERPSLHAAVRNKNSEDGILFVTTLKLLFLRAGGVGDPKADILNIKDIKVLQVNKESPTSKPLLRVAKDNDPASALTFEFMNKSAADQKIGWKERDNARNIITRLTAPPETNKPTNGTNAPRSTAPVKTSQKPTATETVTQVTQSNNQPPTAEQREREQRAILLANNPELKALHKDLVSEMKIITDAEFWESRKRQPMIQSEMYKMNNQTAGLPSALLLSTPKNTSEDKSQIRLTATSIYLIFKESPAIERLFREKVPHEEFWTKYFETLRFHSEKRATSVLAEKEENIFAREQQESDSRKDLFKKKVNGIDISYDISANDEQGIDNYGIREEIRPKSTDPKAKPILPMIRKFNRHAQFVLEGSTAKKSKTGNEAKEKVTFDDLDADVPSDVIPLNIKDSSVYFSKMTTTSIPQEEIEKCMRTFGGEMRGWSSNRSRCNISSEMAVAVLNEVCNPQLNSQHLLRDNTPTDDMLHLAGGSREKIEKYFRTSMELLRHFWSCFPIKAETAEREKKIIDSINRLYEEMKSYRDGVPKDGRGSVSSLMLSIFGMLDKAIDKDQKYRDAKKK